MIYGWNPEVWLKADGDTGEACDKFWKTLIAKRKGNLERPIVFVGHGVGGFLIKQVIHVTINFAIIEKYFKNPFMACFFLSVPHHGLTGQDDFADVLANTKCMLEGK